MKKIKVKDSACNVHAEMGHKSYYMGTVPVYLHSKLVGKGMPINIVVYAQVFDWLMSKGIYIDIFPEDGSFSDNSSYRYALYGKYNRVAAKPRDWTETANAAIRITLKKLDISEVED